MAVFMKSTDILNYINIYQFFALLCTIIYERQYIVLCIVIINSKLM
jgi:hypothetical protein